MWLQYWRHGDEIPESRASKRRKSGREGETPEPSVAPKVVNTNIPQFVNTPKNFEGGKLTNYFEKWINFKRQLDFGASFRGKGRFRECLSAREERINFKMKKENS